MAEPRFLADESTDTIGASLSALVTTELTHPVTV